MSLVFEWDEEKASRNELKQGVTFEEEPFSMIPLA
jgi:uncharacterized DUF497 family protein